MTVSRRRDLPQTENIARLIVLGIPCTWSEGYSTKVQGINHHARPWGKLKVTSAEKETNIFTSIIPIVYKVSRAGECKSVKTDIRYSIILFFDSTFLTDIYLSLI